MGERMLEIIADSPALSEAYAVMLLRGPTIESELARHQWIATLNEAFIEQIVCDCWFCEHTHTPAEEK